MYNLPIPKKANVIQGFLSTAISQKKVTSNYKIDSCNHPMKWLMEGTEKSKDFCRTFIYGLSNLSYTAYPILGISTDSEPFFDYVFLRQLNPKGIS